MERERLVYMMENFRRLKETKGQIKMDKRSSRSLLNWEIESNRMGHETGFKYRCSDFIFGHHNFRIGINHGETPRGIQNVKSHCDWYP
tara:strand:- start:16 stop:279 length:264 start_codon:yes stop_codon:yes gene_type:complete